MKLWVRHWYNIGMVIAIIAALILFFRWSDFSILRKMQAISFIAMLVHQFEEYGFPGGEPAIMNIVLQGSKIPDRYPLNQFSAMLTNVIFSYIIYLAPVIKPDIIWLGIAPMLMGLMQFAIHGVMTNIKMKSLYNPGLGAVICLHIPVGIYYLWYISHNSLASGLDWVIGVLYTVIATGAILGFLTYIVLADKNTVYAFGQEEMQRFRVQEKLEKKNITITQGPMGNMLAKFKK